MQAATARAGGVTALRVLRVRQWRHFALLPAASIGPGVLLHPWSASLVLARGALVASLALAFAYGVNAVHDRATDRSAEKNPLAGAAEVALETRALVWGCGALALVAAAPGGAGAVACAMVSLLTGAVYSAGPRLKTCPFVGTALNVGIFLPLMWVAGPLGVDAHAGAGAALPVTFVALLLQNQLWHEREDLDEDRAAAVRTTASVLGERGTGILATAAGVLGAILAAALAAGHGRPGEALAAVVACALGISAPLFAAADRRRGAHRAAAIAGGALLYAAGLAAP